MVFLFSALAYANCFTYPDSNLYCTALSLEQAQQECSVYESCKLENYFLSGTCQQLSECQKIMCKSSCSQEFSGKCSAGAIPAGKEAEWCSGGCCKFYYFGNTFCGYKSNKWLCEIEANNKDVSRFRFAKVEGAECFNMCSLPNQNWPGEENVSATIPAKTSAKEMNAGKIKTKALQDKSSSEEKVTESFSSNWWLVLILFGVLLFLAVLVYTRKKFGFGVAAEGENVEEATDNYSARPSSYGDLLRAKFSKVASKHEAKARQYHRKEFLMEAGLTPLKIKEGHFSKLRRLVNADERHQKYAPPSPSPAPPSKKAVERLGELIKANEAGEKVAAPLADRKSGEEKAGVKSAQSQALKELREIVRK